MAQPRPGVLSRHRMSLPSSVPATGAGRFSLKGPGDGARTLYSQREIKVRRKTERVTIKWFQNRKSMRQSHHSRFAMRGNDKQCGFREGKHLFLFTLKRLLGLAVFWIKSTSVRWAPPQPGPRPLQCPGGAGRLGGRAPCYHAFL